MSESDKLQYPEPPVRPKNRKLTHPWRTDNPGMFASSRSPDLPEKAFPYKQGMSKRNRAR